ncbi:TPA: AAA family ATPase [Clostridium botulinum]|nr:AAA family ATPase [Clostridium botulinum]HBJ1652706.1 AAA family ATPase [Clostridium botulinum]
MARARKGGSIKTKMGFLLYGKQGTWKSSLALQFAKMKREDGKPFRVLYLDAEAGSVDTYLDDLVEEGYDIDNIYIVYTQSLEEVNQYIAKVTKNEDMYELDDDGNETDDIVVDAEGEPFRADAVVIDSASVLYIASQQGLTEFSKIRAKVRADKNELTGLEKKVTVEGAGLEIKDYNTLKFSGQDLVLSLLGCGKHFAVIAREQDEKQTKETSEKGKFTSVATGNKIPDGFKDLAYNVKTVLHMIEDDMGNVMAEVKDKDRTKVHARGEIIENPTLLDWEVVVTKNKGKRDYILSNSLNDAVEKERNKYIEKNDLPCENNCENTNESIEELKSKIKAIVDGLNPTKKKALKPKLEKVGLTTKFSTFDNINDLHTFLKIVEE